VLIRLLSVSWDYSYHYRFSSFFKLFRGSIQLSFVHKTSCFYFIGCCSINLCVISSNPVCLGLDSSILGNLTLIIPPWQGFLGLPNQIQFAKERMRYYHEFSATVIECIWNFHFRYLGGFFFVRFLRLIIFWRFALSVYGERTIALQKWQNRARNILAMIDGY